MNQQSIGKGWMLLFFFACLLYGSLRSQTQSGCDAWTCKDCPVITAGLGIVPAAPVQTKKTQKQTATLPAADYLVVTWTVGETSAMAKTLGGGKYWFCGLESTANNFVPLRVATSQLPLPKGEQELSPGDVQCHAFYFTTTVKGKKVVCLKSNFHPKGEVTGAQHGLAMEAFFKWLVSHNHFKYIISSGTGGGVWPGLGLGDVVVCDGARFDPNEASLIGGGEPVAPFPSRVTNIAGSLSGGMNNFDMMEAGLGTYAKLIIDTINNARDPGTGKTPRIYYAPLSATQPNFDISDLNEDAELGNIRDKRYDTLGATFDNNDAFVAEACSKAHFGNWVSIRNISDVATAPAPYADTYTRYQFCSSVIGALAVYAFIAGH